MKRETLRWWVYRAVLVACLLPAVVLIWKGVQGDLGANPIEKVTRNLGVDGLRLLLVGLALTPLARALRNPWILRLRRPVGLFAFGYISLHLMVWLGLDIGFDLDELVRSLIKRPFILAGMMGFALLLPLALTSWNGAIRRMGPTGWRRLHQLVYLAVPAGLVHHFMLIKADYTQPVIYGSIAAVLLGWRALAYRKARSRSDQAK